MTGYVIKCVGFAIPDLFCGTEGMFLQHYDPDIGKVGRGTVRWTPDPSDALMFATQEAAFDTYLLTSKKTPVRPDGKPNRPLTAYTITIEPFG